MASSKYEIFHTGKNMGAEKKADNDSDLQSRIRLTLPLGQLEVPAAAPYQGLGPTDLLV